MSEPSPNLDEPSNETAGASVQAVTERVRKFYEKFNFPGVRPLEQDGLILMRHLAGCLGGPRGKKQKRKVLDAGCGTGNTALALARRYEEVEFLGIDLSAPSLAIAGQAAREAGLHNGRSKLSGESAVLEVWEQTGLPTVIMRPVAIFEPGQRTPFGRTLRKAVVSRILLADGFLGKQFCFVHVEDVAGAAVHLLEAAETGAQIYNVAAENPIRFMDAFRAHRRALRRSGRLMLRARALALLSLAVQGMPAVPLGRIGFRLWHPGFDYTYSSKKLLDSGFRFKWNSFEEVMLSCIVGERSGGLPR
jgi:SAM-dependent methyltransferase